MTMIHTYSRPEPWWSRTRLRRIVARVWFYSWCTVVGAFVIVILVLFGVDVWKHDVTNWAGAIFLGVMLLGVWLFFYWETTWCKEIRLGDDGTCEFETRRGVVRTRVHQISSVREEADEDGDVHYYILFRDRRTLWTSGLRDFEGFLGRIKTMNPAIEIKGRKS